MYITEMIRNGNLTPKIRYSIGLAIVIHVLVFAFVKNESFDFKFLTDLTHNLRSPLKIDQINFIKPEEVDKLRKVGIKNGQKKAMRPDLSTGKNAKLSLEKLAAPPSLESSKEVPMAQKSDLNPLINPLEKPSNTKSSLTNLKINARENINEDDNSHFYFDYKNQKTITRSKDQDILKTEAAKNLSFAPSNKAADRISNFEIRYERPEGVSEDELNSDEKAYYSFYVRSYKNYFTKIYANYEKLVVQRPALSRAFDQKHLLIGKIDYDEEGNIVTVKILKSSDNDDLHYFFEETLKDLNQPNPPKIFTKNRKQFSIYYQIQIN